jgi:hypothetical protein
MDKAILFFLFNRSKLTREKERKTISDICGGNGSANKSHTKKIKLYFYVSAQ